MAKGFPPPTTATIPANGIVTPSAGDTYFVIDQKFHQPYVEAWNLAVERMLPYSFVATVSYVGNHGTRIPMQYDLNAAIAPGVDSSGNLLPRFVLWNRCASSLAEPQLQIFSMWEPVPTTTRCRPS